MKNLNKISMLILAIGVCVQAYAQDSVGEKINSTVKKTGQAIKRTAKKVGNKTAEVASKSVAEVSDNTYKGKAGPNGETIYIDKSGKYFYVDSEGKRVHITKAKLKNKGKG